MTAIESDAPAPDRHGLDPLARRVHDAACHLRAFGRPVTERAVWRLAGGDPGAVARALDHLDRRGLLPRT